MSEHGVALASQPEPRGSHGLGAEFCLRDQEEVRVRGAVPTCEPEGGARRHSGTGFRTGFYVWDTMSDKALTPGCVADEQSNILNRVLVIYEMSQYI